MKAPLLGVAFLAGSVVTSRAVAQSDYGIEFVSVGAPGNEAFNKPNWEDYPNSPAIGRGRVDYTFRMAKYETTTAQYLEFANTFYGVDRGSLPPFLSGLGPIEWGAGPDPNYHGPGRQWKLDTLTGSALNARTGSIRSDETHDTPSAMRPAGSGAGMQPSGRNGDGRAHT